MTEDIKAGDVVAREADLLAKACAELAKECDDPQLARQLSEAARSISITVTPLLLEDAPIASYTYRRATPQDLEQLVALQRVCFPLYLHDDDAIRRSIAEDVYIVCEHDGAIVGHAIGTTREELAGTSRWHLYAVEVAPAHRRKGLAWTLVSMVLQQGPQERMTALAVSPEGWRLIAAFYPRVVPVGCELKAGR